jgi:GNAT superfamily N-acetyltransferase
MPLRGSLRARLASQLARRAGLRFFRLFSRALRPGRALPPPDGLRLRVLRETELLPFCGDAELGLRPDQVATAYARGDLCVAAFDADALAGYCWFAFAPLPHLDGVWVDFRRSAAWTYKSMVRDSHRGRGIAPAIYGFADDACAAKGCTSAIICMESHNAPSISAALRAGYASSGRAAYLRSGNSVRAWYSAGARADGVRFYLPGA